MSTTKQAQENLSTILKKALEPKKREFKGTQKNEQVHAVARKFMVEFFVQAAPEYGKWLIANDAHARELYNEVFGFYCADASYPRGLTVNAIKALRMAPQTQTTRPLARAFLPFGDPGCAAELERNNTIHHALLYAGFVAPDGRGGMYEKFTGFEPAALSSCKDCYDTMCSIWVSGLEEK